MTGTIIGMVAFLSACLLAVGFIAAIAIAMAVAPDFVKNYQILLTGFAAIIAAAIAFLGAAWQAKAISKAATDQISALKNQTDRNYEAAVKTIQASARASENQIEALKDQTQAEFDFRHREAEQNKLSLIAALHAEILAVKLGIKRRDYIAFCRDILDRLVMGEDPPLPEFGFTQNYLSVMEASAARIGELPFHIAQGVTRVSVLAKSAMDQANLVHATSLRTASQPISRRYKIGLMRALLADAVELSAAIDDILPKLVAYLASEATKAEPENKPN